MFVYETRFPSVYSLQQLEDDAGKGYHSDPQGKVSSVVGQWLPKISFGSLHKGRPHDNRSLLDPQDGADTDDSRYSLRCMQPVNCKQCIEGGLDAQLLL